MALTLIDLSYQDFILINGPLVFLNLVANTFYACCLIFPRHNRQRLKQPLKMLLGFLVWCTIMYFSSFISMYCEHTHTKSLELFLALWFLLVYSAYTSMTSYVWLNFYYFTQIVPARRAALIWVKKNIKFVMYLVMCLDRTFFLFCAIVSVANVRLGQGSYINNTQTENHMDELHLTNTVCFFMLVAYTSLCLCVTVVSISSMVRYLLRHMKSMAVSGSTFSSPRLHSQMRVTITGICQALLYFLHGTFHLLNLLTSFYLIHFKFSNWVICTVTTVYISGTTLNLGIGQTIFRQRAVDLWKALKAKLDIQLTSIAFVETFDNT